MALCDKTKKWINKSTPTALIKIKKIQKLGKRDRSHGFNKVFLCTNQTSKGDKIISK